MCGQDVLDWKLFWKWNYFIKFILKKLFLLVYNIFLINKLKKLF